MISGRSAIIDFLFQGVVFNVVPNLAIVTTSIIAPFIATKLISKGYSITNTRKIMEVGSIVTFSIYIDSAINCLHSGGMGG